MGDSSQPQSIDTTYRFVACYKLSPLKVISVQDVGAGEARDILIYRPRDILSVRGHALVIGGAPIVYRL